MFFLVVVCREGEDIKGWRGVLEEEICEGRWKVRRKNKEVIRIDRYRKEIKVYVFLRYRSIEKYVKGK